MMGARLKAVREHFGLNATDMAARVDLSGRSSWERYERGKHTPNGEILLHLSEMGINTNWVLTGQGQMLTGAAAVAASTPAAVEPPAIDEDPMARVAEGIADVYKTENARIAALLLVRLATRMCADLVAVCDTPEERLVGLKMALQQLRRDLRTPEAGEKGGNRAS